MKTTKTILGLIFVIVFANSFFAYGQARGGNSGGGGTGIRVPGTERLIFWDLYLKNPHLDDSAEGDLISLNSGAESEYIDYRNFKSLRFLQERIALWQLKMSKAAAAISSQGFLNPRSGNTELGLALSLIGTRLYMRELVEISVPSSLVTNERVAYPVAFIDLLGNVILNVHNWNRLGLKSQAALLLHERLRYLQRHYVINNSELQNLVSQIILDSPTQEASSHENLFSDSNISQTLLPYVHGLFTKSSFTDADREACLQVESVCDYNSVYEIVHAMSDEDLKESIRITKASFERRGIQQRPWLRLFSPSRRIDLARFLNRSLFDGVNPGGLPLQSSGSYNLQASQQYDFLFQYVNCPFILRESADNPYNPSTAQGIRGLRCSGGQISGEGRLRFTNQQRPKDLRLEIDSNFTAPIEAASMESEHFIRPSYLQINFFTNSQSPLRIGFAHTFLHRTRVRRGEVNLITFNGPTNPQNIILQVDSTRRLLKVYIKDYGNRGIFGPAELVLVASIPLSRQQLNQIPSMQWSIDLAGLHSSITEIRVKK